MKKSFVLSFVLLVSGPAMAQGVEQDNLYGGAGLNSNSVSGADDAVGYQFFAGYQFDIAGLSPAELAAEVGFFDSGTFESERTVAGNTVEGEFEADGLWANAVFSYSLGPAWHLLGRAGLDFGDDDGLMFGGGAGYAIDRNLELRGEFVIRDNIDSLQANLVFHF